jgi:intraflagellar transport protein 88
LQALARYKAIDAAHPGNAECLRYLVHLCSELGRRDDAQKYMEELRKAERLQVGRLGQAIAGLIAIIDTLQLCQQPGAP